MSPVFKELCRAFRIIRVLSRAVLTAVGAVLLLAGAFATHAAAEIPDPCVTGPLPSGGGYLISAPPGWNAATGSLLVYTPGYLSPYPHIQFEQLDPQALLLLNNYGFAVAAVNYRKPGLAIKPGVADVNEFLQLFYADPLGCGYGRPQQIYVAGASEGGLIATLAVEQAAQSPLPPIDGGLAVCGPVGDFRKQLDHFMTFRVVFNFFFPGVIPGSAVNIPDDVIADWNTVYEPRVRAALRAAPAKTKKLISVTRAAVDPANPATAEETAIGLLKYNVAGTRDAIATLGGQPFDNRKTIYFGAGNFLTDLLLNMKVERYSADAAALLEIETYYQTSGRLQRSSVGGSDVPLFTGHTVADPIVPYWHEPLYTLKTLANGSATQHLNFPVFRYGHCSFNTDEVVGLFGLLVLKVSGVALPMP